MILSAPPLQPQRDRTGRGGAGWHLIWGLGVAAMLAASSLGWLRLGGLGQAALAFALTPALVGLALWRDQGPRFRFALAGVWAGSTALAMLLSGGVTGPLGAWALAPLMAGLVFGGRRERAVAAAGSLIATAVGLAAAVAWPAPAAPVAAALATALLAGSAAWSLLGVAAERETALEEQRTAAARLEQVLTVQPFLTLCLDAQGGVLAAFGQAQPGVRLEQLTADGLSAVAQPSDRPTVLRALEQATEGETAEVRFAPHAAVDRLTQLVARALPDGRLIAVLRDVSDQHARETALDAARAEAEALHLGKSRFLANMSHELRTPLNAVLGFSDMMRQRMFGPLPEKYLEYANLIHEAGGHLLDLINDVLDMSKIEAERFELARERFDARDPVSAALRLMRLQAHDKAVDLRAALPAEALTVEADKRALKQIVLNLLSNAVKFTPAHGSVTLTLEARGDILEIAVADTGVGVSQDDIERLGRPYEQAGEADQRARGTGLGLSLVRSLTELHGGRMSVESTLGEGSVFTVRLPIIEAPRASGQVVPFPGPLAGPLSGQDKA